ncbi:hypothetical protein KR059_010298, partial [Drosophila kikkawai]
IDTMTSIKEDSSSVHSAASRETDREREREREKEHENELLQSPSKFKTQTLTKTQAPEAGASPEKYVRVRDMINLYNFAMQKNQELEHAKSILFGRGHEAERDISGDRPTSIEKEEEGLVDEGQDNPSQSQASMSQVGERLTVEKSYRSKTTLRRTDQGVRIIIDIFMDKNDSEINIVGSRVETDIPESRILADFQKQSLEMEKIKFKQEQAQVCKIA